MLLQIDGGRIVDAFQVSWHNFLGRMPGILLAILIVAIGIFVADKIAEIKCIPVEELKEAAYKNTVEFFNLDI